MKEYFFAAGILHILITTGYAILSVGNTLCESPGVVGWDLPIIMFIMVAFPFVFGWLAG